MSTLLRVVHNYEKSRTSHDDCSMFVGFSGLTQESTMRLACVLVLAFVLEVNGFGLNFWRLQTVMKQKSLLQYTTSYHSFQMADNFDAPESHVIIQPLDHFDPQIKDTYGQRYWVNSKYWNPPHGPVFLYIGGESGLSNYTAADGAYIKFAETYGALVFVVEHRFYGQSLNDDGLKLENLKYLSSQQALADLASFHLNMTKTYNLTATNKWISFGGSYSGALSAWVRVKYPHLVHAAIASSAPVRAIVDFQGFNDVVAKSLATDLVGGSQKCADMVRSAFRAVDDFLSQGNLTKLSRDFLSCQPIVTQEDIFQFVSNIADAFKLAVQYYSPIIRSIEHMCKPMTQGQDAYQNLVILNKELLNQTSQECSDNSWNSYIQQLSNETLDRTKEINMRQWIYQTCTQFGYYQACNDDDCLFSRYTALSPNFDICKTVFKFDTTEVYDRVDFTNSYYGSDHPGGSRILFVNGLIDPWHALSVLESLSSSELALVIPDTAHCADMLSDSSSDPPSLTEARQKISEQIGIWLRESDLEGVPH